MEILCSKEEYERLYYENPSLIAIAKILGVSDKKIANDFKKLGIEYHHDRRNTSYRKKIIMNDEQIQDYIPESDKLTITEHRVYDEKSVDELWNSIENYQEMHNGQNKECELVEVHYDDDYVVIAFLADIHVGSESTEMKLLRYHIDEIRKRKNLLLALCGDYADNFITFAQNQQLIPPSDQHRLVEFILNSIKDKTIGCIRGNHEERTKKVADVDLIEMMCTQLGIPYMGANAWIKITVKDIEYKIHMAHDYRYKSSLNLTHTVKRMFEKEGEFDIGLVAHEHVGDIEQTEVWGKQRIFIRPGTYMIRNRWALNKSYNGSNICVPCVLLFGDRKQMISFYNIEDALKILDLLQKEKK